MKAPPKRATTSAAITALLSLSLLSSCNDKKPAPGATPPPSAAAPTKPAVPGATPPAATPAPGAAQGSAAAITPAPTAADAGPPDAAAGSAAGTNLADASAAYDDPNAPDNQPESIFEVTSGANFEEDDPRRKIIEAKLSEELGMPTAVLEPIGDDNDVYAIYQHSQVERCAPGKDKRPANCPPAEAMTYNPDCKGHGLVHARFDGEDAKKPPKLSHVTLEFTGCELKLRHWFAASRKDGRRDAEVVRDDLVLEVVASYVAEREPAPADAEGDKADAAPPRDSIHRQQHLTLWGPNEKEDEADWFSEELASWTAETWRIPEPRVLDSFLLHEIGPFPQLAIVQLLPCHDPTSDDACATELRKRSVHRYAKPIY